MKGNRVEAHAATVEKAVNVLAVHFAGVFAFQVEEDVDAQTFGALVNVYDLADLLSATIAIVRIQPRLCRAKACAFGAQSRFERVEVARHKVESQNAVRQAVAFGRRAGKLSSHASRWWNFENSCLTFCIGVIGSET
ncbi:hypothetical protein K0U83_00880 [bacterium]|nr:hypothetical protein [bacterium]